MRFSLTRTVRVLLVLVLLQLAVYYWITVPRRRGTGTPAIFHWIPVLTQKPVELDYMRTCADWRCPAVKAGMLNVHLIPHSHVDPGWKKTVDQYYKGDFPRLREQDKFVVSSQCVRCVLNTSVEELLKNPERRFNFIEMAFFSRYWSEIDDNTRERVKTLIERRQLEIVLGGWVMSDAAVTHYSDLVDQLTLGWDFLRQNLGPCAQSTVAWHVDQFGHSRELAALLARMGFDALFVGRIDFQDHDIRMKSRTLEFVWETSPNIPDNGANLFTHVTFDGYSAPSDSVMDFAPNRFTGPQATERVDAFIAVALKRAKAFQTQHLLMPMGSDFGYSNAADWFDNMDRLIQLVNQRTAGDDAVKVNLLYSTPSCYIKHVHRAGLTWGIKTDDFHPYAVDPGAYWTGYFTSRPGQKLLTKRAAATLQACKQLGIFTRLRNAYNRTDNLRRAVSIMQHHDAITGTAKQHVSNDYNRMLSEGIHNCQHVVSEALEQQLALPGQERGRLVFCDALNISQCPPTEQQGKVHVLAYNPLSRQVTTWLRLPVTHHAVNVRDSEGHDVPSQVVSIGEGVMRAPGRSSISECEVLFPATLPPMGFTSFLISSSPGGQKPVGAHSNKDIVIENQYLKVTFDGRTGRLKEVQNVATQRKARISQDFAFYNGGKGAFLHSSGAYLFVPEKGSRRRVGDKDRVEVRVYQGPVVQEVHQRFSSWVSQVVRLYKEARHLELEWTVGPIPTEDGQGKEVVSSFVSDLKSKGRFYTDSNGREILERRVNHRETWNLTVVDPISGNYYPVTSRIYIKDQARDTQLTLIPDRCQGGSSLHEGALELMVHRRLLYDDGLGVEEALDERGTNGEGVVHTGKHLLFLDTIDNSVTLTRQMALHVHFAPTLAFRPLPSDNNDLFVNAVLQKSFLTEALPPNVQILSLDYTHSSGRNNSIFLLRLEHVFERTESLALSTVDVTVHLKTLFSPFDVTSAVEVSLGGNFNPGCHRRLKWTTRNGRTNPATIRSSDYKSKMEEPFTVTLQPMEIRTFRIFVSMPSPSPSSSSSSSSSSYSDFFT